MIFVVEILNIVNTISIRFAKIFKKQIFFTTCIVSKPKSFQLIFFVILVLWTSRDQTFLDFLSRSQLIVNECGSSSFNNKIPIYATPHHYMVSFISWTKINNKINRCDHPHITTSSSPKIPGAPTILQVLSS